MSKAPLRIPVAGSLILALSGFSSGGPSPAAAEPTAVEKHWSYETHGDAVGPEAWGTLPGNAVCSTGRSQSPVALFLAGAKPTSERLSFDYIASPLRIVNNGHAQQVNVSAGSRVAVDGESFPLLQFHFHAPSEHTLEGKRYPMEMHLVHAGADGKPALVVAVLIAEGPASTPLGAFFANLPMTKGASAEPAGVTIDPETILPASKAFLHYAGSLTTPPCTEGIRWFVLTTPITASTGQITAYVATGLGHTDRPIQPLGGRVIRVGAAP